MIGRSMKEPPVFAQTRGVGGAASLRLAMFAMVRNAKIVAQALVQRYRPEESWPGAMQGMSMIFSAAA